MAIIDVLRHAYTRPKPAQRSVYPYSIDQMSELIGAFGLDGRYPTIRQTLQGTAEEIGPDFAGLSDAFQRNGILYAAMAARQSIMSQARFQFQELRNGVPGDLFGNEDLAILENPWPNAQTSDLIARAVQDADLAGNFFAVRRPNRIRRLRPDWVGIILGSGEDPDKDAFDIDSEVIGYVYYPGGYYRDLDPVFLLPENVAHWAPTPDPTAAYRGMSWITPVIREIMGDSMARDHKIKFFENGATTNLAVTLDIEDAEKFKRIVEAMDQEYKGLSNAYKTLYMAAGAVPHMIGRDFQQMDFKVVQAAGENRIASASGLHPVILGLSDSLQGASLNQGNFTSARRLTADKTLRPMWAGLAGALQTIIPTPGGARLWYDDRHIPFLADDVKDAAEVRQMNSSAMRQLIDGGFEPDTVVDAIVSGDLKRLKHSGLTSVQLLPPGTVGTPNTTNTPNLPSADEPAPKAEEPGRALLDMVQIAALQRSQPLQLTIEDGAFRVETPITFPEGFVRSETTIEPAQVTIEEGAVTIAEGAIHSETPITVHPAEVTIADGAMRSETTVNPPKIEELTIDTTQFEGALQELRDEIRAPRSKKIIRDKDNVITEVREESA